MKTRDLSTRRRFFFKAGAALSAPLAAAGVAASERGVEDEALKARLTRLEDENAIRALNQAYAAHINAGAHDAATALFVDASHASFDETVRGLSAVGLGEQDVIEVGPDERTATARIHCAVRVETPIEPDCTLAQMARAQGEGVLRRSERRVLEGRYVKVGGVWRIERLG